MSVAVPALRFAHRSLRSPLSTSHACAPPLPRLSLDADRFGDTSLPMYFASETAEGAAGPGGAVFGPDACFSTMVAKRKFLWGLEGAGGYYGLGDA